MLELIRVLHLSVFIVLFGSVGRIKSSAIKCLNLLTAKSNQTNGQLSLHQKFSFKTTDDQSCWLSSSRWTFYRCVVLAHFACNEARLIFIDLFIDQYEMLILKFLFLVFIQLFVNLNPINATSNSTATKEDEAIARTLSKIFADEPNRLIGLFCRGRCLKQRELVSGKEKWFIQLKSIIFIDL